MSLNLGILASSKSAAPSSALLLDTYTGASIAYSLRKLRTAYTGSAIRVRRSSDNTELDIGFINNYLDITAISTFCGSGNGFVTRWYDQSGNNNFAAVATAAYPQIYFLGSFVYRSGKIYVQFSTTAAMQTSVLISRTVSQNYSFWITYEKNASGNQSIFYSPGTMWLEYGQTAQYINNSNQTINITPNNYAINTRYLVNHICDTSIVRIYSNGNSWGSRTSTDGTSFQGIISTANRSSTITMTELIFYSNSQLANRTGINTNINSFYTIY